MFDLVIKNGTVVTATASFKADVGVNGEKIVAVGLELNGEQVVDAAGCYVIPGGVDVHVHFQMSVGKYTSTDDFERGSVAAACGGTTTFVDFVEPKGEEPMLDALARRREEADGRTVLDYGLHMTIPAWHADHALDQIPGVMAAGIYSFKMYQAYGPLCLNDTQLFNSLAALAKHGGFPILHSENGPVIDRLREEALAAGCTQPHCHPNTRPADLEGEAVHRALLLAQQANAPLFIVHVSCAAALLEIAIARQRGQLAFGETCPQYLYLTLEKLAGPNGSRFICAPPLRTEADQAALWNGLAQEVLQVMSTDHCPFTTWEKAAERDFTKTPSGLSSLEPRVALIHQAVLDGHLSLNQWVASCCTRPAQLFRLPNKGHIAPGYDADLVVFDPAQAVTITPKALHESADWTPYEGIKVSGWVRDVIGRGQQLVLEGNFVGVTGRGHFLRAG